MHSGIQELDKATVLFAGDSGDGIQLAGYQFSQNTALQGNDLSTFPDFPAEIRAPIGTQAGVSGFKINFGNQKIFTPGGKVDMLVAFNVAALHKNLKQLKKGGTLLVDSSGFDKRNHQLAGLEGDFPYLEKDSLSDFKILEFDIQKMTREALKDTGLSPREMSKSRNIFALGLVYWLYSRPLEAGLSLIAEKFKKQTQIIEANQLALRAGYNLGETIEESAIRYNVGAAELPPGNYRSIMGNEALAYGLIAAAEKSGIPLFYASYPITPASDILHELAKHKNFDVKTFQAEDEIAAISAAIGASYGGVLAATGTSGPGMALKTEGIGLAIMLEIPLIIINVQRGGPSTGLPTKTEQADLGQAVFGRNGEAPLAVLAPASPSECFSIAFEACRIAIEHMTPVIILSDGYLANGSHAWKYPQSDDLKSIEIPRFKTSPPLPYARDERGVRSWMIPGIAGEEHRIGGLEKADQTGNISYEAENHQKMVDLRAEKIQKIVVPYLEISFGEEKGDLLILGWGSTYGAIREAVEELRQKGLSVSQAHLRYINPLPKNIESILGSFNQVLIPEMNSGQLLGLLKREGYTNLKGLHKIQGLPFLASEISEACTALFS